MATSLWPASAHHACSREAAAETDGEAQQDKGGSDRQQHKRPNAEKEAADNTPLQRRCRYATELLAAIRCFISDFRDIEEQLNKGEKKKQKANRTVNMAVEKSDEGTLAP